MFCIRPLCVGLRHAGGQVRDKLGGVWLVFVIPDADCHQERRRSSRAKTRDPCLHDNRWIPDQVRYDKAWCRVCGLCALLFVIPGEDPGSMFA